MMMMKQIGRCALMGAMLGFVGCATQQAGTSSSGSALRVGTSADYPPLSFMQGDSVAGIEVDLGLKLGEALGQEVQFVPYAFNELIPALLRGEVDIVMSGMSVTRAREYQVGFSDSYLRNGLMAAVLSSDEGRYKTAQQVRDFNGIVGVMKNTTGEAFVKTSMKRAKLQPFDDFGKVPYYFSGRRIRMFIHDGYAIASMVAQNETELAGVWEPLTDEDLAWALRKEDAALRQDVNALLSAWKSDGTLDEVLDRWLPFRKQISWPKR